MDYSESEMDSPGKNRRHDERMEVDKETADPPLECRGSENKITEKVNADPPPQGRDRHNNPGTAVEPTQAVPIATAIQAAATSCATPVPALGNGFNDNLYQAIRKLRTATLAPRHLGDSAATGADGTLISRGTVNMGRCHYRNIYDSKMNISFSFEPRSLTCFNCAQGPHHILGEEYQPACVILSDQHFPAALPADGDLRCPAIIRAEDGTISDLISCFRKTMGKSKMPVGSVIMVGSLSHLARVGLAAYATDLLHALTTLEEEYGNRIRAVHALPIPNADFEDEVAIRALFDIMVWLDSIDKRSKYCLPELQKFMLSKLSEGKGEVNHLHLTKIPVRLPAGFKTKDLAAFSFGGVEGLVKKIPLYAGQALMEHLSIMLQELNSNFAVNLDEKPDLSGRTPAAVGHNPATKGNILVAGSSHASRLASELGKLHENITDLSISGWKLSEANAKSLAEDIGEKLEEQETNKAAVVLQL